jgi:hypothetical protein
MLCHDRSSVCRALDHRYAIVLHGEAPYEIADRCVLEVVRGVVSEQKRQTFRWQARKACDAAPEL